jgi:hypothetical protein
MEEVMKNRILKKRWEQLEKQGLKRPKDQEENDKRAEEAHGG